VQEEDVLRYHVVLEEKLLKNDLHNGMHRETMLGSSYLLGFFLRDDQVCPFIQNPGTNVSVPINPHLFHIGRLSPVFPEP
jgi:hypothetical protein